MRCSLQANCTFRNTVVFLPKEPYLGTCKHYSILKVLRNENKDTIDEYRCQVFQLGVYPPHPGPKQGTLFIPMTGSQGPSSNLRGKSSSGFWSASCCDCLTRGPRCKEFGEQHGYIIWSNPTSYHHGHRG